MVDRFSAYDTRDICHTCMTFFKYRAVQVQGVRCLFNAILGGGFGTEMKMVGIASGISDVWAGSMNCVSSKCDEHSR